MRPPIGGASTQRVIKCLFFNFNTNFFCFFYFVYFLGRHKSVSASACYQRRGGISESNKFAALGHVLEDKDGKKPAAKVMKPVCTAQVGDKKPASEKAPIMQSIEKTLAAKAVLLKVCGILVYLASIPCDPR